VAASGATGAAATRWLASVRTGTALSETVEEVVLDAFLGRPTGRLGCAAFSASLAALAAAFSASFAAFSAAAAAAFSAAF
jgi:hypothetical protein